MPPVYPARSAFYLAQLSQERPLFQGDVLRAIPSVRAAHPVALQSAFAGLPATESGDLPVPPLADVKAALLVDGGFSLLLPNPGDFSEAEKGANHRERILAQIRPIQEASNQKVVRQGTGAIHTFWLPHWDQPDDPERDVFVSLRRITTVDSAYLCRSRRVAALSLPAWICLIQRVCAYFGGVSLSAEAIVIQVAHLYPE